MSKARNAARREERELTLLERFLSGEVYIDETAEVRKKRQKGNRKSGASAEDDGDLMVLQYTRILRILLPGIMAKLSRIEDPRDPNRILYSLESLLLYGILMFISLCPSRRSATASLSQSGLLAMVGEFVGNTEAMPHADTLARLLERIDVESIDRIYEEVVVKFIHSKQFNDINPGPFRVAVDGTQKFTRKYEWDSRALSCNVGVKGKERHYVYVLESILILNNGLSLPLLTEILENHEPDRAETTEADWQAWKQDSETKAFRRLASRLKKLLGTGCVEMLMDGIYASGPVISCCNEYGWNFMITLKKGCLTSVWEDFNGLRKLESDNAHVVKWGDRFQQYEWSNDIEYIYGKNHKALKLNVVTCVERWRDECPRSGGPIDKETHYAWLSSKRIDHKTVYELCMKARTRWYIENGFKKAKHHGYSYSHCFSYDWETMKGFHYLMKFGLFINAIITGSLAMRESVQAEGIQKLIEKIWTYLKHGDWPKRQPESKGTSGSKEIHKIQFPELVRQSG